MVATRLCFYLDWFTAKHKPNIQMKHLTERLWAWVAGVSNLWALREVPAFLVQLSFVLILPWDEGWDRKCFLHWFQGSQWVQVGRNYIVLNSLNANMACLVLSTVVTSPSLKQHLNDAFECLTFLIKQWKWLNLISYLLEFAAALDFFIFWD